MKATLMPLEYRKLDIHFQYPDNWTLDEEDAAAGSKSVTVYSPGGAFWTLSIHPPGTDPARLSEAALEAMREEYKEVESEEVHETLAGHDLIGHDLNFYYLDLTNTAWVRSVQAERATYTIFHQAEDRELKEIEPVLRAMTVSFLSSIKALGFWDG